MNTLWTPWRMSYILGHEGAGRGCIFDFPDQTTSDKEALLLRRDRETVTMLNRFPYANGHLLVAPVRHVATLTDLDHRESSALMGMLSHCTAILQKHLHPDGFNIGLNLGTAAGAGQAEHLHFHIVPRWDGDHNFMTVLADIRTIPQHIEETYDQLLPHFAELTETP